MLAGQSTTGATLTWALYELSRHPEIQTRIREEIKATRTRGPQQGNGYFTVTELDSMKWLLAVIKVRSSMIFEQAPPPSIVSIGNAEVPPHCHIDTT